MDISTYKHIIWDWNGTLIDDAWLCVEIVNELLCRRKKPPIGHHTQERLQSCNVPVLDCLTRIPELVT